jgi:hypothetical protein
MMSFSAISQTVESVVSDLKSDVSKKGWTFMGEYSANTTDEIFVSSRRRTYTPGYDYLLVAVAGDCRGCEMQFKAVISEDDESYTKPTIEMKGQVIIGAININFDKNTSVEIMAHIDSRYSYFTKLLLYQKKK